ncbi:alpha-E domain-containing protein [Methylotetracoccus oryzae]|uniref:alpha-E domain-containing protein n=1 Tax=Methylotetracoccus oryzae TaxID=1919059 RepID=UPI0019125185|nr:alpha-E domain-containing protein [Methylotetracoccus oryzae]
MAMLSRVAEHLYWMARYLERAENMARLITANGNLILDLPKDIRPGWDALIAITGSHERFYDRHTVTNENNVLRFLIGDDRGQGSILSALRFARENARTIRDIVPRELWEQINGLYLHASERLADGLSARRRFGYLQDTILGVQQIAGIGAGTMSHDAGYEFYRLGCNLERADMTTRILDVRYKDYELGTADAVKPFENILWTSVLKSLTAYQMYRRHRQAAVRRTEAVDFLMKDESFPRSVRFCVLEMEDSLRRLPRSEEPLKVLEPVDRLLRAFSPDAVTQKELHEFVDELQICLGHIHDSVSACYFEAPAGPDAARISRPRAA